eukprot:208384-Chlamydomonas_euryale.AAC.4
MRRVTAAMPDSHALGIVDVIELNARLTNCSADSADQLAGSDPVSTLPSSDSWVRPVSIDQLAGSGPVNALSPRSIDASVVTELRASGRLPANDEAGTDSAVGCPPVQVMPVHTAPLTHGSVPDHALAPLPSTLSGSEI